MRCIPGIIDAVTQPRCPGTATPRPVPTNAHQRGTTNLSETFEKMAYPLPLDYAAVETDWRAEGFSFRIFRDPPGQQWNDFTHASDEYVLVAEGRLWIEVGDRAQVCEAGDLVRIPRQVSHSLHTLSDEGSVWLYGYGYWNA